jgi:hypothetical protein
MRALSRAGPALLLLGALAGCNGDPASPDTPINPNLPQVTLEVPGMT